MSPRHMKKKWISPKRPSQKSLCTCSQMPAPRAQAFSRNRYMPAPNSRENSPRIFPSIRTNCATHIQFSASLCGTVNAPGNM